MGPSETAGAEPGGRPGSWPDPGVPAADAGSVARAYLAALGDDDVDAIVALVGDGFRNEHLSALGEGSIGRQAYRERLPAFLATFPRRTYDVDDVVIEPRGDTSEVVVRYRLHAVHGPADRPGSGDPGAGSAGTTVAVPGIMWLTISGGLVRSRIDCWDSLTFLRQVGSAR